MPSANASPITGSELIRAVQDGNAVRLTRAQLAIVLGAAALPSYPLVFEATQGGNRITLSMADIPGYLAAASAVPDRVPAARVPGPITGQERIVGVQAGTRSWSYVSTGAVVTITAGASTPVPSVPTLPVAPAGFTALPLATAARTMWFGDSYVERGTNVYTPSGNLAGGKYVTPQNLWSVIGDADRRFAVEVFQNPTKPATSGSVKIDGAMQGLSGGGVHDSGFLTRVSYAIARNPQIVVIDIGKNDVNTNDALATIQANYTAMLDAFFNAKVWVVLQTQAAFREGASPGDWSVNGAQTTVIQQLNTWIKSLASRPGVAGIIDTVSLDGLYTVANPALVFNADKLHLLPYGVRQRVAPTLAVLQPLVSPAGAVDALAAANVFTRKSLSGTAGSKSSGTTGSVADGMRVTRQSVDTTDCSKGTNSQGEATQIITVTPTANGTVRHAVSFSAFDTTLTYASMGLAVGDWIQMDAHVALDGWSGWDLGDADVSDTAPPIGMVVNLTDSAQTPVYWTEANYSGGGRDCVVGVMFQIPSGTADRFQQGSFGVTIAYRSDVGGTGAATIDKFRIIKRATPQTAWGL